MSPSQTPTPDDIPPPDEEPKAAVEPDSQTQEAILDQERRRGELELDALRDLLEQRKSYATKLFYLLVGWMLVVVGLMIFVGWKVCNFYLSDQVLIALLTSTTVTVVGLFLVVAKFLFPGSGGESP